MTFVFTDLVVSTRLWEVEREAMSQALARHDEILRAAIAAHEGQVVKGRGDGVHAVFVTADDAVRGVDRGSALAGRGAVAGDRTAAGASRGPHRRGGAPRR